MPSKPPLAVGGTRSVCGRGYTGPLHRWSTSPVIPDGAGVMEGAGEDPYLGSCIARPRCLVSRVKKLGDTDGRHGLRLSILPLMATAIRRRDYNSVDMSPADLMGGLPPRHSGLPGRAGAATFMNSFNDLNGIPATGNAYLQLEVLKGNGSSRVLSSAIGGSVGEDDPTMDTQRTIGSGIGRHYRRLRYGYGEPSYINHLAALVREGDR